MYNASSLYQRTVIFDPRSPEENEKIITYGRLVVKSFAILQGYVVFLDNVIIDTRIRDVASYRQLHNSVPYLNPAYANLSLRLQRVPQYVQTDDNVPSKDKFSYSAVEKIVFCQAAIVCVLAISIVCAYVFNKTRKYKVYQLIGELERSNRSGVFQSIEHS